MSFTIVDTKTATGGTPVAPVVNKKLPYPEKIDMLQYNKGTFNNSDPADFDDFNTLFPELITLNIYDCSFIGGFPEKLFDGNNLQSLSIYRGNLTTHPAPLIDSQIQNLRFSNLYGYISGSSTLPAGWNKFKKIANIYLQNNGYSVATVDGFVNQIEALAIAGMGSGLAGIKSVYLNGTGAGANGVLTTATHVANGWTNLTTYIQKTIAGNTWRIYKN